MLFIVFWSLSLIDRIERIRENEFNMLLANITYAFKNKGVLHKISNKVSMFFYLEAWKKQGDSISNLITWNINDESIII